MELFVSVQCIHNMGVHCCVCVCQQLSVAIHFYSLSRMKSLRSAPALGNAETPALGDVPRTFRKLSQVVGMGFKETH